MLSCVWGWVVSRGPRAGPHRKGAVEAALHGGGGPTLEDLHVKAAASDSRVSLWREALRIRAPGASDWEEALDRHHGSLSLEALESVLPGCCLNVPTPPELASQPLIRSPGTPVQKVSIWEQGWETKNCPGLGLGLSRWIGVTLVSLLSGEGVTTILLQLLEKGRLPNLVF